MTMHPLESLFRTIAAAAPDLSRAMVGDIMMALDRAGYHNGPKLPEEGTAEWEEMVERAGQQITGAVNARCCHIGGWAHAETRTRDGYRYGGDVCDCRLAASGALRAALGGPA
jgi:hypothetical protein